MRNVISAASKRSLLFLALFLCVHTGWAQDEPQWTELTNALKKPYCSIGLLFQAVADFQVERSFPGNNGFNIANVRLKLSGDLDGGYGYFLQTSFLDSPAILDAKMYYKISPQFTVDFGLFKPPLSKEYLTGADAIDFVNRSQVVNILVAGRQIGIQASGKTEDGLFSCTLGIFNGNKSAGNNNDDNSFMTVGRLAMASNICSRPAEGQLEFGINAAYSDDSQAPLGNGTLPAFDGKRTLMGVDARVTYGDWLFSAEGIVARLAARYPGTTHSPYGYQLTGGSMVSSKCQLLCRFDSFSPDGLLPRSDLFIVGCNIFPTHATEVQINYIIPTTDDVLKHHQVLINAQLSF